MLGCKWKQRQLTLSGPTRASNNGQLDIAETWTYTINYTVTQTDVNAGAPLVNNAIVTTNEGPDPKTDSASTPVVTSPSIHLEKQEQLQILPCR